METELRIQTRPLSNSPAMPLCISAVSVAIADRTGAGTTSLRSSAVALHKDDGRRDSQEEKEISRPIPLLLLPETAEHCGRKDAVSL